MEGRGNQEAATSLVMLESYIRYQGPQIMIMFYDQAGMWGLRG